jgi:uncharacterized protein with HEPN domain
MKRNFEDFLQDILTAAENAQNFVEGLEEDLPELCETIRIVLASMGGDGE